MRKTRKTDAASQYGHNVSISARVSPATVHAINVLISSGLWDFNDVSSFMRTAILRQLEYCEEEEPGIGEWHHVAAIEEIIRVKDEQLAFEQIIKTVREQCNQMADAGEWDDMQKHLENVMATIYHMAEGSRKQRYLGYMQEIELRLAGFKKTKPASRNGHRKGMTMADAESERDDSSETSRVN